MKPRRHRFDDFFYDGDWHTELMKALKLAEEGTSTPALRAGFAQLRTLLAEHDECTHVVTLKRAYPRRIDGAFMAAAIRESLGDDNAVIDISERGYVTVTAVRRGSEDFARARVASDVDSAILDAESDYGFR